MEMERRSTPPDYRDGSNHWPRASKKHNKKSHKKKRSRDARSKSRSRSKERKGEKEKQSGGSSDRRRERSPMSNSPRRRKKEEKHPPEDATFDLKKFKYLLDRMFFRDSDIIRKGSVQYDDFWKFHEKIQAIRGKGSSTLGGDLDDCIKSIPVGHKNIEIPKIYSKKHTVPFSLQYTNLSDYIYKLNPGKFH